MRANCSYVDEIAAELAGVADRAAADEAEHGVCAHGVVLARRRGTVVHLLLAILARVQAGACATVVSCKLIKMSIRTRSE